MEKSRRRFAVRAMAGVVGLTVLLLAVGFFYELRRERYLTTNYEPPGEMIDIGTHRLHLYCSGSGRPPVLLEAGSGLAYVNWVAVQTVLSGVTRTCSYDRSGLGWSEQGPTPPSANQATDELVRLLDAAGMTGPWVVVGHSLGGLYAQQLLNLHPQRVAALVLVDSTGVGAEKLPEDPGSGPPSLLESYRPLLSLVGLHRLSLPVVPESDRTWVGRELHATSKHVRRGAAEWWGIPASIEQVREAMTDWGDTRVVVLQAGSEGWPASYSASDRAQADRVWTAVQKDLAGRSSRSRYLVVEESGHGIPWEAPEVVIDEVEEIVQDLRDP